MQLLQHNQTTNPPSNVRKWKRKEGGIVLQYQNSGKVRRLYNTTLGRAKNFVTEPLQNIKSWVGMIGSRDPGLDKSQFTAIVIDKDNQTLRYYDKDSNEVYKSRVFTGAVAGDKLKSGDNGTPNGEFKIVSYEDNKDPEIFGDNIFYRLGNAKLGGSTGIGIHGDANFQGYIGTKASHGCIRMHNDNLRELQLLMPSEDLKKIHVIIRGHRLGVNVNYLNYYK